MGPDLRYRSERNMKTFSLLTIAAVNADDKKVPPRHPLNRLTKLQTFAFEWCDANLTAKQAANWQGKFGRNTHRFQQRFEQCGFYNADSAHGGPERRKRRSGEACEADDVTCIFRYNKHNPMLGLQQIMTGYRKWAERYVSRCMLQPGRQRDRANKWFNQLGN